MFESASEGEQPLPGQVHPAQQSPGT